MITLLSLITIIRLHYTDIYKKPASLNATIMTTWDGSSD